jgi:hypothetical protein
MEPETKPNGLPDSRPAYTIRRDHGSALAEYQTLLRGLPASRRDQVLYLIGLIKSDTQNPDRDIRSALANFQELTTADPASSRYDEARILSSLITQIIRLEQELAAAADQILTLTASCREQTECCSAQKKLTVQVQQEIAQLKSQIERLKLIDLGIEEKKREQQRNQQEERNEND